MSDKPYTPRDERTERADYKAFVAGLTQLTRRYVFALSAIGGVTIAEHPVVWSELEYVADISSGDLYPAWDES